ncbi:UvrD-helicase domain-containing protein [Ornithinimicrobium panacihumi]|uniref:UvrD-helicase domain-containing protein n=1 Tax=Ornithinimicrobium panacihumi TaxID=2008449 RepID=UPI003F8B29B9
MDESQVVVARIGPESRQIVLAGPGSGKSRVVGEIVSWLVEEHGVFPEEVLVLSFSRAAVEVVRERTAHVTDLGGQVGTYTLDSLARRLLADAGDQTETGDYDTQIGRALAAIEEDPSLLRDFRHVIVDEVQDVVGLRARFVLGLLSALATDSGFSLLGDPLQSLYDFQLDEREPWDTKAFLGEVQRRFSPAHRELLGEYRSRGPDARAVSLARTQLLRQSVKEQSSHISELIANIPPMGVVDQDCVDDVSTWRGSTALLCDTNARAALVAQAFVDHGLLAERADGAQEPALDPWIGAALQEWPARRISYDDFGGLEQLLPPGLSVDEAWRSLRAHGASGRVLDLAELASSLARTPLTLKRRATTPVVASTVHRAKGLEYDNVILVDVDKWSRPEGDLDREVRQKFVALSRARARVSRVSGIDVRNWHSRAFDDGRRRWIRRSFRGNGSTGLIMEAHDSRALGPALDVSSSLIGRSVEWGRSAQHLLEDGEVLPSWEARTDGIVVARTSVGFGAVMRRLTFGDRFPGLSGGYVDGLETVVGQARTDGPGRHGIWLGARIVGPLELRWDEES